MKGEEGSAMKTPSSSSKRTSLKTHSNFNNYYLWKDKLRENCYRRVRQDRSSLLWKTRLSAANSQDAMKSAFQDIVSDELKKFKGSSLHGDEHSKFSSDLPEESDLLWEYDGQDAYKGDCEEILLEMQRIFYEDLVAQPQPTKTESENYIEMWEDEEDEYLARAVFENMQLNDDQVCKKTWCPICKQGELQEGHKVIHCTLCKLHLSKGDEVGLERLQTRLAEAHTDHFDRGCRLKPMFCVETRFGLTALYILCQHCSTFDIVVCTKAGPCVAMARLCKISTSLYLSSNLI